MKKVLVIACVLSLFLVTGCKKVIFKADFQNFPQGSPAGPPPGNPTDDQILVHSANNPVVIGSQLVFRPPQKDAYFFSHPVANQETTKSIFWIGRLKTGEGPFSIMISAEDTPGLIFPGNPLWIRIFDEKIEVRSPDPGNPVLHSHELTKNGQHEIYISLQLQKETYSISVKQLEVPEIKFTGQLHPWTAKYIKEHSRLVMEAAFSPAATGTHEYEMQEVIMREKKK